MSKLEYEKYGLQREKILEQVKGAMSKKRFRHSLGVEKACIALAEKYHGNVTKASIAGLTHDYAKERSNEDFLNKINEKNLDKDLINWGNPIWHGVVGSYFVKEELKVEDEEILSAIKKHTTGSKEMTLLEEILYVADYIEENRDFPGVDEARKIAFESLEAGVIFETKQTLKFLIEKNQGVYPKTLETYNYYVAGKKE